MDAIAQINQRESARLVEASRFVEEQKIRKALGPAMWQQLKAALRSESHRRSERTPIPIHYEEDADGSITIKNLTSSATLNLWYDENAPCIHYEILEARAYIAFRVIPDGTDLQFMDGGLPRFTGELVLRFMKLIG